MVWYVIQICFYKEFFNNLDKLSKKQSPLVLVCIMVLFALFMPYDTIDADNLQFFPKGLMIVATPYYLLLDVNILVYAFKKNDKQFPTLAMNNKSDILQIK